MVILWKQESNSTSEVDPLNNHNNIIKYIQEATLIDSINKLNPFKETWTPNKSVLCTVQNKAKRNMST